MINKLEPTEDMEPAEYFFDAWVEYKFILVDAGIRVVTEMPEGRCMVEHQVPAHHCYSRVLHRLRERAIEWARVYRRGDLLGQLLDSPNMPRY